MADNFIVKEEESGRRIDLFLADKMKQGCSRTFIKELILAKKAMLNDSAVKPHQKVRRGDRVMIEVTQDEVIQVQPQKVSFRIIFEDHDVIVIDKPSGLVVHPGAGNLEGTLVSGLLMHTKELSAINPSRPGIVHRLDKETSGVMVAAKNNFSHLNLVKQFSSHSIKRKYTAIVNGQVEFDQGLIDLPIGRHKRDFKRKAVSFVNSKEAVTHYKVLKRLKQASLLELIPRTGRTHQLRVHLAHLGYPILGDSKYGRGDNFTRLALHAQELGFHHPGNKRFMVFSSPLPQEFLSYVASYA